MTMQWQKLSFPFRGPSASKDICLKSLTKPILLIDNYIYFYNRQRIR